MRVLLADDRAEVRSALRLLLEQEAGFLVIGEAAHGACLLEVVQATRPELLLLDWELPGPPINELIRLLRVHAPTLSIVALSGHADARGAALATGAVAFISKGEPAAPLLAYLRERHTAPQLIDDPEQRTQCWSRGY